MIIMGRRVEHELTGSELQPFKFEVKDIVNGEGSPTCYDM